MFIPVCIVKLLFCALWSRLLVLLLLSYVMHSTKRSCLVPICILSLVLCWLWRCLPLVLYLLFFVLHTGAVCIIVAVYPVRLVVRLYSCHALCLWLFVNSSILRYVVSLPTWRCLLVAPLTCPSLTYCRCRIICFLLVVAVSLVSVSHFCCSRGTLNTSFN
jgi:hypothetical protein